MPHPYRYRERARMRKSEPAVSFSGKKPTREGHGSVGEPLLVLDIASYLFVCL
jgi:hypothetical protein